MNPLTWQDVAEVMGWNAVISQSEANREPDGMAARVMQLAGLAAERAREAYEREHCRHTVPFPDALRVLVAEAVAAEREAVILAAIEHGFVGQAYADDFAAAVRARGAE